MKLNAATRLRADGAVRATQRSPAAVSALPHFSVAHAEEVFQVGHGLYIDNVGGLGHTPDNQSALYKGFIALLPCSTFESLALHDGGVRRRAEALLELMRQGYGIGNPCLYINADSYVKTLSDGGDVSAADPVEVVGHEGRARTQALVLAGVKEVPVQMIPLGFRARHFTDHEGVRAFMNKGIIDERGRTQANVFDKPFIFG